MEANRAVRSPPVNRVISPLFILVGLILPSIAGAQFVSFEGDYFPENAAPAWIRIGSMDAQRWLDNGLLCPHLVLGAGNPGPYGQFDAYQRAIAEFTGSPSYFVTWREGTDCPRADIGGQPGGLIATSYTSS